MHKGNTNKLSDKELQNCTGTLKTASYSHRKSAPVSSERPFSERKTISEAQQRRCQNEKEQSGEPIHKTPIWI